MFTPMALTVLMALTAAAVFSITFVPAAVAIVVAGKVSEMENIVMRAAKRVYLPLLERAIAFRWTVALAGRRDRGRERLCGNPHGRRVHPEP